MAGRRHPTGRRCQERGQERVNRLGTRSDVALHPGSLGRDVARELVLGIGTYLPDAEVALDLKDGGSDLDIDAPPAPRWGVKHDVLQLIVIEVQGCDREEQMEIALDVRLRPVMPTAGEAHDDPAGRLGASVDP